MSSFSPNLNATSFEKPSLTFLLKGSPVTLLHIIQVYSLSNIVLLIHLVVCGLFSLLELKPHQGGAMSFFLTDVSSGLGVPYVYIKPKLLSVTHRKHVVCLCQGL